MFQPKVQNKRIRFRNIRRVTIPDEKHPEVAIALPGSIIDNDSLIELQSTTQVLIITTEHFEGHLIRDRGCTALRTAIDENIIANEYRVLYNPQNEKRGRTVLLATGMNS